MPIGDSVLIHGTIIKHGENGSIKVSVNSPYYETNLTKFFIDQRDIEKLVVPLKQVRKKQELKT